jgi:phosphoglycolate phosphatase
MSRTLALDLDGTLVDSLPDLAAALNRLAIQRGFLPFTPAEILPMVGDGIQALLDRAMAARGRTADPALLHTYLTDYTAHVADLTRPFPDVAATLARLRDDGWILAVCTNKPEAASRRLLTAVGLAHFFAAIGGGDSFPVRKPDPAHLLATLRAAGGDTARAAMVGDHHNDVLAATGAGLPCIFAAWGYGTPAMAEGAAAVAKKFAELPELAERLLPA